MEIDLVSEQNLSQTQVRRVGKRGIINKISALERGEEFFDGRRENGYGGYINDGRWLAVAGRMIDYFKLTNNSNILILNCEKAFLLDAFLKKLPGVNVMGTETSEYAISCIDQNYSARILKCSTQKTPFLDNSFDLVVGLGVVYVENLSGAINVLNEIKRISRKNSYVTLATFDSQDDYFLFKKWSLLGSTLLSRNDWKVVLEHVKYNGNYQFVSGQVLRLQE